MQPMHIVYSSDNNYAQHMGASIYSLLSHNTDSEIVVYVIDNGISSDAKEKLQQIINQFPLSRLQWIDFSKWSEKLTLNAILNQRSQDVLAANNWNVCQYAVLVHMLAQVCGMKAGEFVHVIADAHIYDRHVPMIEELISREPLPAPTFWLNPEITDFYDFTPDDVRLDRYETHPQIKNIPIAV